MARVSSLPPLGLEYFHEYLDRYSAKEETRKTSEDCARSDARKKPTPANSNSNHDKEHLEYPIPTGPHSPQLKIGQDH